MSKAKDVLKNRWGYPHHKTVPPKPPPSPAIATSPANSSQTTQNLTNDKTTDVSIPQQNVDFHHSHPLQIASPPLVPHDTLSSFMNKNRKIQSKLPELQLLIAAPHPALVNFQFLFHFHGMEVLHHPVYLMKGDAQREEVWRSINISHFKLLINKRFTSESYDKYFNTYLSLWNITTHCLADVSHNFQHENPTLLPLICFRQAVSWLFMTKDPAQTASIGSHFKFFVELGALPSIDLINNAANLLARNSKFDKDSNILAYRLVLGPQHMLDIMEPILSMKPLEDFGMDKPAIHIYIVLALTTGQHLQESFNFMWSNYQPHTQTLTWPPFKHRKDYVDLPVSCMFLALYKYVSHFCPHWLISTAPVAHQLWSTPTKLGDDIATCLAPYQSDDPVYANYDEKLSHRHLRRSFASILHQFNMSHAVIKSLLTHNSSRAIANYIALYHVEHVEFIKGNRTRFLDFLPPGTYVNDIDKPKLFTPEVPAFTNKKRRQDVVPMDQPLISAYVHNDQHGSHSSH